MFEKIRDAIIPHIFGLILMFSGWLVSIVNVGWNSRGYQAPGLVTKWTFLGLLMILAGAYLPEIWLGIRGRFSK